MTLEEFFEEHPKIALAFSGGVDSSYLLYAASRCGADVAAYYVKSQFQPEFELRDAIELAHKLGVRMRLIEQDIVSCAEVTANPPDRCYYCKKHIMGAIRERSCADGYALIIDGTNASDDIADRPRLQGSSAEEGTLAAEDMRPDEAEIRQAVARGGLPTWDKPAYACLATRIASGEQITAEKLRAVEQSEDYLFSLGFTDFRVRVRGNGALLQFTAEQTERAHERLPEIEKKLAEYFDSVTIDPKVREKSL